MGKINILPSKVYNRIAAGEVVERPCSVVKELIENSIDAGATEIEIHIEKGGKQLIRVIDNGCGIERDDLQSAFLPHATSKIAEAEDLERIMTLGFRGEAVASIASISKMSITSKTANGKCYRLESNGGEMGQIKEAAGENGTDVCVEMLFFNAPVRLNFLKTDKGEEAEITNCISRFILNRSDIAFNYYADGKKILQSFSGGDEEALVSVYGASVLRECIKIDAEKHGVRVRGYIGNQNYYKANKTYQSVFLNGRYIVNATISSAISNAYASYLMKRQYPFYVLHIDVPQEIVDVNVHPNKADVRFSDNKIIYGCIYTIISAVLDGNSKALEYVVSTGAPQEEMEEIPAQPQDKPFVMPKMPTDFSALQSHEPTEKVFDVPDAESPQEKHTSGKGLVGFSTMSYEEAKQEIERCKPDFSINHSDLQPRYELDLPIKGVTPASQVGPNYIHRTFEFTNFPNPDRDPEKLHKKFPDLYFEPSVIRAESPYALVNTDLNEPITFGAKEETGSYGSYYPSYVPRPVEPPKPRPIQQDPRVPMPVYQTDVFESNKRLLEQEEMQAKQQKMDISTFRFAGKLFNTYLLYERDGVIYIIDQHAAHERIIFDKLREKMRNRTVVMQPMISPYEIQINHVEADFLKEREQDLLDLGITVVHHEGDRYRVTTTPVEAWRMDVHSFMHEILANVNNYKSIRAEELIRDKLATSACKAAVKGGMNISQQEIDELFKQMDGDMGMKCPHGRPIVVTMTKSTIEKMFKRIR